MTQKFWQLPLFKHFKDGRGRLKKDERFKAKARVRSGKIKEMETIQPHITKFDKFLSQYKFLSDIEKSSSIPKVYLVATVGFILSLSIIFDVFAEWTVGLLALVYPLHTSLKAITKSDANATKSWLLYFCIISVWSFIDMGGLPSKIIPYYYPVKSLVIIWLIAPNLNVISFLFIIGNQCCTRGVKSYIVEYVCRREKGINYLCDFNHSFSCFRLLG